MRSIRVSLLLLALLLLAACGGTATPEANSLATDNDDESAAQSSDDILATAVAGATSEAAPRSEPVRDIASLRAALEARDATLAEGGTVADPLFPVEGQQLTVNGQPLQLFEFASEADAAAAAGSVDSAGSMIGEVALALGGDAHFYYAGRLITLYVGSDSATLDLLQRVQGPPFAGVE